MITVNVTLVIVVTIQILTRIRRSWRRRPRSRPCRRRRGASRSARGSRRWRTKGTGPANQPTSRPAGPGRPGAGQGPASQTGRIGPAGPGAPDKTRTVAGQASPEKRGGERRQGRTDRGFQDVRQVADGSRIVVLERLANACSCARVLACSSSRIEAGAPCLTCILTLVAVRTKTIIRLSLTYL